MESSVATDGQESVGVAASAVLPGVTGSLPFPAGRRERATTLGRSLALADLIAVLAAAATGVLATGETTLNALGICLACACLWPLIAFAIGLYRGDDLRSWATGLSEVPRLLVGGLLLSWPLFAIASILDAAAAAILTAWITTVTVLFSGAARAMVRTILHQSRSLRQRTLILGSGVVAGQVARKVATHDQFGLVPLGIVDDDPHDVGTPDLPRLGGLAQLDELLSTLHVDRVIIAFSRAGHDQLLECIRVCRDHGVAVDVIPRLFELLDGVRSLDHLGGLPVLSIGIPRLTRTSRVAKRILDLTVASIALTLLAPLMLVIAILIKAESRGPVFFRQVRAGRGGRSFRLFKFRSMYAGADGRKPDFIGQNDVADGVMFKIHRDPRVTRVGYLLRRSSLDELPQLINVLRGEMSLVGPRPLILPEATALEEAWQARRLDLRPGMTGPWQVNGRSETPFHEMLSFDYQYVAGWTLLRDIEILLATVPAVLSRRGAY